MHVFRLLSCVALLIVLLCASSAGAQTVTLSGGKKAIFLDKDKPRQDMARMNFSRDPGLLSPVLDDDSGTGIGFLVV